jgi:hypothetical protein
VKTSVSMTIGPRDRTSSRLDSRQEGDALLLAEIFNHHLIVRRQRTSATQQPVDRQLEMLFTVVWCVRRHASNIGRCRAANR